MQSLPGYNVVGGEIRSQGDKIQVVTHSIEWAILDAPDLPVAFDSLYAEKHHAEVVERWRKEAREIDAEIRAEKEARR